MADRIARRKAKKATPEYFQDPEIARLDDKVRAELLTTRLAVRLPLDRNLQIRPTRLGFEFIVDGQPPVSYAGWAQKKNILRCLAEYDIHVDGA